MLALLSAATLAAFPEQSQRAVVPVTGNRIIEAIEIMKTIAVSITEEQAARLKRTQAETGVPVSVQVRRALEDPESQRAHTWINFTAAVALTNEQLAALRTEAQRLGRPLSDAESRAVLGPLPGSTAARVVCGPDEANGGQPRQLTGTE